MIDRKVERMKKRLRKLTWYQKLHLRAWLNTWYDEEYKKTLEEE
tara:strand:+ start:2110 stop:2241 length:132 start_codon:yes stop_codon:yes gene_type:complete